MTRQDDNTGAEISVAALPVQWQMLGVHGQHIGFVEACGIDLQSGRIAYVVLVTPWQSITVPWDRVWLDRGSNRFQLLPAGWPRRRNQDASE